MTSLRRQSPSNRNATGGQSHLFAAADRGESYLPGLVVLVALAAVGGALVALALSPASPAAGRAVGGVVLVTKPPGALAQMDGRLLGRTPVTLEGVEAGEHFLKFDLGGYRIVCARARLDVGSPPKAFETELKPEPVGNISITSEPDGAKVYVSGEFHGHTPLVVSGLSPGTYTVLVRETNCEPFSAAIVVPPDGKVELKAKLEDKVLRFLLAAIEAEPTIVDNFTDLGHYYFIKGMLDESVAAYVKGLELCYMPDVVKGDTRHLDSEIKKHYEWRSPITPKFRERMDAERIRLAQKYPGNVMTARQTASSLLMQGKADEAVKVLTEGVGKAPDNPEMQFELGRAQLAARECNKALASFETALKLSPNDVYLKRRVAKECIARRPAFTSDDDRRAVSKLAKKVLEEAIGLSKDRFARASMLYELGRLYAEEELMNLAARYMAEAVGIGAPGPTLAQWQMDLAGVYAGLGKTDEARDLYKKVLDSEAEGIDSLRQTAEKALKKLEETGHGGGD